MNKQEQFSWACSQGNLELVKELASQVDINALGGCRHMKPINEMNGLQWACHNSHFHVVKFLLSLPGINVNVGGNCTPIVWAQYLDDDCAILSLLVQHPQIKIDPITIVSTIFCCLVSRRVKLVKMLLAGRQLLNLGEFFANPVFDRFDDEEVIALLTAYIENPAKTRNRLRIELGWPTPAAAIFAAVIFACDGLLQME